MDPATLALLGQAGISIIGELIASGQEEKARALLQQSRDEFGNISLPKLKEVQAQELGASALGGIQTDPRLEGAQYEALGGYDDIIDGGGLAAQDKAAMNRIGSLVSRGVANNRAGLTADMEARGMRGSGADIAAQLASAQAGGQRLAASGDEQAALAAQQRIAAITQKGAMAGSMRNQQYGEKSRAAEAADAIARFNAQARSGAADANNGLAQQQFGNAMGRQAGKAGATTPLAAAYQGQADSTRQMYAGAGAAVGRAGSGRKKVDPEDDYYKNQGY